MRVCPLPKRPFVRCCFPGLSRRENSRKIAIEITAAGIDVEKVSAALRPGVNIGRSEHQRDDDAYDDAADSEFFAHVCCDVCRSLEAENSVKLPAGSRNCDVESRAQ